MPVVVTISCFSFPANMKCILGKGLRLLFYCSFSLVSLPPTFDRKLSRIGSAVRSEDTQLPTWAKDVVLNHSSRLTVNHLFSFRDPNKKLKACTSPSKPYIPTYFHTRRVR